jgi:hypothetical protein
MNKLQRRDNHYPAEQDNFVSEVIQRHLDNEPRRENNFLSNIFSKRVTNNFIRIKVYRNCNFYLGNDGEEDD